MAIRSLVPGMRGGFDEESREKPREAIDAFRTAMTAFEDEFVDRKRQHLLFVRSTDAEVETNEQRAHLERAERQYQPIAAKRERSLRRVVETVSNVARK